MTLIFPCLVRRPEEVPLLTGTVAQVYVVTDGVLATTLWAHTCGGDPTYLHWGRHS